MNDLYTLYEAGLQTLLDALRTTTHPRLGEALVYEQRLRENIQQCRVYGEDETRRSGRAEIIARLNALSSDVLGVSFNDLCATPAPPVPLVIPPAHPATAPVPTPAPVPALSPTPLTSADLQDPALIVTFYGQRGQLQPLRDHLVNRRQLIQENAMTFTHEATRTLLLDFDLPGAADTSVIQLALNSTDQVVPAWTALREQLTALLNDRLLQWPIWGYTLVYQAMLTRAPAEPLNTTLQTTLDALLPVIQPLRAAAGECLPPLASGGVPGGLLSLHRIPLDHDGLEAATIYVALSVPDRTNELVRQVLLKPGAFLLMPDLIAHKGYHQMRQYRSAGWLDVYNQLVQSVRSATSQALTPANSEPLSSTEVTPLNQMANMLLKKVQDLQRLRTSLAQQQANYPWWREQFPSAPAIFQFHQRHLDTALQDLELLIDKGTTTLAGARSILKQIGQMPQPGEKTPPVASERPSQPDPLKVTLQFAPTKKSAHIIWQSEVSGTVKSTFTSPYKGMDLALVIRALDALQYPGHPLEGPTFTPEERTRLEALGLWGHKRVAPEAPRIVGQKLYAALRRSRAGSETLTLVREAARSQGRPINYILRFPAHAVDLAALPWEVLWDERQAVLLSRGGREIDSCERYLDLDMALSPPLPTGKKLRVLALAPHAAIPQDVRDAERAARIKHWEGLQRQGLLEWNELSPVTTVSLDEWIRHNQVPDIVHYYGHGIYTGGQGYLLFDTDEPSSQNQYELVSASRLAAILGGIRLIVMFACQSAMVTASEHASGLLTGVAPALSAVSEVVVAMQLTTRIHAATHFSNVFYAELARGRSVQAAVADARRSLYVTERDGMSWYVPTVYIRTREQKPVYLMQHQ